MNLEQPQYVTFALSFLYFITFLTSTLATPINYLQLYKFDSKFFYINRSKVRGEYAYPNNPSPKNPKIYRHPTQKNFSEKSPMTKKKVMGKIPEYLQCAPV